MAEKKGNQHDDFLEFEDWFSINEQKEEFPFRFIDCGCIDPVPASIMGEFSYDLKEGEEVEMHCPECNGTMRKQTPKEKE